MLWTSPLLRLVSRENVVDITFIKISDNKILGTGEGVQGSNPLSWSADPQVAGSPLDGVLSGYNEKIVQ